MEVTYELTQRDFYESFLAHRNRSAFAKWSLRLFVVIMFLVVGVGLVGISVRPNAQSVSTFAPLFVLAGVWAGIVWGFPWFAARSQFNKQPAAQGPRTMSLDSAGVHWRWKGGSADIEWKNYIRVLESKNQFLLYSSPACFNIVPQRALTPEKMSEFRSVLAQHLSQPR